MNLDTAELRSPGLVLGLLIRAGRGPRSVGRELAITIISLVMLAVLGWIDVATSEHIHFGLLYVVPVLVASWYGGRWPGYALDLAASLMWLKAGRPTSDGPSPLINGANLLIRGCFYALVVELLVMLRSVGQSLERSVRERTIELRQEITDRLRAEESLRKLAAKLSEAEDVERRRLAYDIHDALSQMLGVVKINLETVVAETATDSRQFERLSDVVKTVDDLIRQTRDMTFDLHPSMLDHFGLVPTLQKFVQDFSNRTHADVTVSESGERRDLAPSLVSYMFRAIKELINNAMRHGNAKEIIVSIHWDLRRMRTVVDDDGTGFDPATAREPHARRGLGLAGIDERLTSFGGSMRAESQPGNGARIILEVPTLQVPAEWVAENMEAALV